MSNILRIVNHGPQKDAAGEPLWSHGGHILRAEGWYYLYGEDRRENKKVSVYRSRDLTHWEYRGTALDTDTRFVAYARTRTNPALHNPQPRSEEAAARGVNIERPKVLFNAETGRYVMWMHWENGNDYLDAHAAVASSPSPDGPFVYHGSFRPVGHMSRDCTLFQDDDGTAYFISAARDNADLNIYRLTSDYMAVDELVKTIYPQCFREAPALVKRGGIYFLLSSECTGWEPNQGCYGWAESIEGRWSELRNFGSPTTYDTQPTFMLTIQGSETSCVLYVGDRWDPTDYHNSRYIALPVRFPTDTSLEIDWHDEVEVDVETGRFSGSEEDGGLIRILAVGNGRYLLPDGDGSAATRRLGYANEAMLWRAHDDGEGRIRLENLQSGLFLGARGDEVVLAAGESGAQLMWTKVPQCDGAVKLMAADGRALTLPRGEEAPTLKENDPYYSPCRNGEAQAFLLARAYK